MCEPHLEYRLIWIETCNQHLIKNSMTYLTLKGHMILYYQLLLVAFCLMTSVLFLRNVIFTTLDSHAKWFLLTCVHLHVTISNSNHQYGLFISTVFMEYFLGFYLYLIHFHLIAWKSAIQSHFYCVSLSLPINWPYTLTVML